MEPNTEPIQLMKSSLPYYDSGFEITDIRPVMRDGNYGRYIWGRAIYLTGRTPEKKQYKLELKDSDTLLGALLYMHAEGKPLVVFTFKLAEVIASGAL